MYTWGVSFKAEVGKGGEFKAWFKEVVEYLNKDYTPAVPWSIHSELFGEGRFYMIGGFNSLADIESGRKSAGADQDYLALVKRGQDARLYVAGSRRELLLESV